MYILINTAIYKDVQNTITNPNVANTCTIYQTLLRHLMHQPLTKRYPYAKSRNTPTLPKKHTPTSHQTLPIHIHQPLIKHYQCPYTNLSSNTTNAHTPPLIKHYQCTYTNLSSNTTNAHTPTSHQTLPMHIHQPLIKHYQCTYTNLSSNTTNTPTSHQTLPIHQPLITHYQCTYTSLSSNITNTDTPPSQHYQCTNYNTPTTSNTTNTPTSHQTLPIHIQYTNLSPNTTNTCTILLNTNHTCSKSAVYKVRQATI